MLLLLARTVSYWEINLVVLVLVVVVTGGN